MELGGGGEGAAVAAAGEEDAPVAVAGEEDAPAAATGEEDAPAAGGEDRLSALPDDVLVLILLKLTTRAAAQTRVLSHRWRRVWALLPVLSIPKPPEPHRLRDALDDHEVLLRDLLLRADGATATAESLAVWLPAAARRVSGELTLVTGGPVEDVGDSEEEAVKRGAFEFPCFEQATAILFILGYQGLAMPVTGVFARLTYLYSYLRRVWFHGVRSKLYAHPIANALS